MREGTAPPLPSLPLLFIAFSILHRSPLSEHLEQANYSASLPPIGERVLVIDGKTFNQGLSIRQFPRFSC